MQNEKQSGFAFVELVLIIVVVAALSFVAIKVMNKSFTTRSTATTPVAAQVTMPSKIQSKADVNLSIRSLDATPINNKLDPNQFDSSISSLL
jgi:Tfp pilus assembly protein FimT